VKRYDGKIVIITGAGSGIGQELAKKLAARGAVMVLADVNSGPVEETADSIEKAGGKATAITLDVSDKDAVKKLVDDTFAENGRLDYIFNNAGIGVGGETYDFSYDDWKRVIDVNLYGVINGVFAAYPIMVKQGFGHIVNTASLAGLAAFPGEISYSASKFGVVGLSHVLRAEGADFGVKVSVVCPGKIETTIYETGKIIGFDKEKVLAMLPKGITPEKCADIIIRGVERNKATIVVTFLAKFLYMLQRISPGLTLWVARQYINKMRTVRIDD